MVFERELNRCAQIFTSAQYSHAFQMLTLLIRKSLLQSGDQLLRWHRLFIIGNTVALLPASSVVVCTVTSYSTGNITPLQQPACNTKVSHHRPAAVGPGGSALARAWAGRRGSCATPSKESQKAVGSLRTWALWEDLRETIPWGLSQKRVQLPPGWLCKEVNQQTNPTMKAEV